VSRLAVQRLDKNFGDLRALAAVDFEVADGEFFCVVGPTNAGKSTLLKTIAGLHKPDGGRIRLSGRDVTALEPRFRNVSLLFQNIALFPTLTGRENIAFPLRTAGAPEAEIAARVAEVAKTLKIAHVLERLPQTFSGGEQQRVAIGRAIARPCDLLMLDEPLTNLDARIRIALRIEFKSLHRQLGQTLIYVTHDQVEAMSMSDRIAVLNEGRFEQIGSPEEIYHRPASVFVARFIGQPPMNILDAELTSEGERTLLKGPGFEAPVSDLEKLDSAGRIPRELAFGLRPEALRVGPAESAETPFPSEVVWVERLGSKMILDLRFASQIIKAVVPPQHAVAREGKAWLGFAPRAEHLIDRQSSLFFR
jgi:multiple sugar transport system ATP-binding protein